MEVIFGLAIGATVIVVYARKVGRHVEEDIEIFHDDHEHHYN
jgi:hypothetical protein